MAATGYTPIQLYRTTTAAAVPSAANLTAGELAININDADMALYAENASGTVTRLINNPAGLKYPTADGTNGQAVITNGSGVLGFTTIPTQVYPGAGIAVSTGSAWSTSLTAPTGDIVGTTGTQTLTNKTIEAGTFTNGYTEETVTANTSTAYTIDLANGSVQILTLTGNCTYTFPTATAGRSFLLIQKQDGTGGRTVTWPAAVKWPSGTAPTITSTASRSDLFGFTADGTNWIGRLVGQNYTL